MISRTETLGFGHVRICSPFASHMVNMACSPTAEAGSWPPRRSGPVDLLSLEKSYRSARTNGDTSVSPAERCVYFVIILDALLTMPWCRGSSTAESTLAPVVGYSHRRSAGPRHRPLLPSLMWGSEGTDNLRGRKKKLLWTRSRQCRSSRFWSDVAPPVYQSPNATLQTRLKYMSKSPDTAAISSSVRRSISSIGRSTGLSCKMAINRPMANGM